MVVCVLTITTLKEKLPRRRCEVHRRRVSIMVFLLKKQGGVRVIVGFIVRYDITFVF